MKNYISIPEPCHEDWGKMTPKEQGRHCDKCNLTVVDFSSMSTPDVLNYFKNNKGRICGRVNQSQLYHPNELSQKLKKFLYVLVVVFLPFVPYTSDGQIETEDQIENDIKITAIKGKLVDENGHPIPYASINIFEQGVLKGYDKTDFNGNYKVKLSRSGTYDLKISSVGYESLDIKNIQLKKNQNLRLDPPPMRINKKQLARVVIKAPPKDIIMGGVGGICVLHDDNNKINEPTEFHRLDPFHPNRQIIYNYELRQMGR